MALIFDIGCNVGSWIQANFNREDTFVGIDANPSACRKAYKNFKHEPKVLIFNYLVSDIIGEVDFYVSPVREGEVSTASKEWVEHSRHEGKWDKPIKVLSLTLDLLIEDFGIPAYIKIDVEGYELKVLRGLTHIVDLIAFEYAEEFIEQAREGVDYLHDLGYEKFNCIHGDNYQYIPLTWNTYKEVKEFLNTDFYPERKRRWGMIYGAS